MNFYIFNLSESIPLVLFVFVMTVARGQVRYSVPEEMTKGSLVGNIVQDLGLDVKRLKSGRARIFTEDSREYIGLNVDKGTLLVKERIDREELCAQVSPCSLHFQIILENPMELHRIDVEILDINDHAPVFMKKEITFQISESALSGARYSIDSANDPDVGLNSIQTYKLTPSDHFTTQSRSGSSKNVELVLQTPLDREKQEHLYLTITATDGGNPKRSGTVKIHIIVLDINDNAPVFQKVTYKISIPENTAKGSLLVTVNATDADTVSNAQIGYYFEHTTPKIRDLFSVDPSSGEIRLIGELDFEESAIHEFKIQAKDQGGLSDSSEVIVEVTDVNDNAPKMTLMSFSNNIPENAPLGTVVAMINIQDSDSEENGKITCFIDRDLPFKIESSLTNYFIIVTDSELDREDIPEYNITITAKDSGSPSFFSKNILNVKITDVNDHAPQFEQDSYNAYVMENNSPSLSLFSVKAHDADLGANARVSYFISDNDLNGTPISSLVSINSDSGTVYATKSFDYEQFKSFTITVRAQDAGSPPLSSNVSVKITIQDQNDNAPQVLYPVQSGASVVAEIVPRGTGTLQHVYNYEVCGTTDSRKSDLKFLQPSSQSVLNFDLSGTRTVPKQNRNTEDVSAEVRFLFVTPTVLHTVSPGIYTESFIFFLSKVAFLHYVCIVCLTLASTAVFVMFSGCIKLVFLKFTQVC
uniref:Cadherin domain-containing protein n=1 Tax=Sinocyclocheilus anshuiensis TaxID=1608454 RepID=A0A671P9X4_9TELE